MKKAIHRQTSNVKKTFFLVFVIFLLMAISAVFINPAVAAGTIYVRADGSIDPPTASIQRDGNVYTFTGNINDSIVVQTNNIVIDGAGFTLHGSGGITSVSGIVLNGRSNVTIKNTKVTEFYLGIDLSGSSNNTIYGNDITNITTHAIWVYSSSNYNTISGNNVTNGVNGITLYSSSGNTISGNSIETFETCITLSYSSSNTISRNNVTSSFYYGISLHSSNYSSFYGNNITGLSAFDDISLAGSNYNSFYGNNIIGNGANSLNSTNVWDGGYPSGGNYWSDYNGTDGNGDGIGDTPYIIDASNQDGYPLVSTFQEYSLTVNVVGSGIVSLNVSGPYVHGSIVKLTAIPDAEWKFFEWNGDLSSSVNPENIIMNGDKSVTATFRARASLPPTVAQLVTVAWVPPPANAAAATVLTAVSVGVVSIVAAAVTNPVGTSAGKAAEKTSDLIPESVKKWLSDFASSKRKPALDQKTGSPFLPTKAEALAYGVSLAVLTISFSYVKVNDFTLILAVLPTILATAVIVEFVKTFALVVFARKLGVWTEHRLWYFGLVMFLVTTFAFGVPFSSPSRSLYHAPEFTKRREGIVSAVAILVTLAFGGVFFVLLVSGFTLIGSTGLAMCIIMAFLDTFPVAPMNGKAILVHSKAAWAVLFAATLAVYISWLILL